MSLATESVPATRYCSVCLFYAPGTSCENFKTLLGLAKYVSSCPMTQARTMFYSSLYPWKKICPLFFFHELTLMKVTIRHRDKLFQSHPINYWEKKHGLKTPAIFLDEKQDKHTVPIGWKFLSTEGIWKQSTMLFRKKKKNMGCVSIGLNSLYICMAQLICTESRDNQTNCIIFVIENQLIHPQMFNEALLCAKYELLL